MNIRNTKRNSRVNKVNYVVFPLFIRASVINQKYLRNYKKTNIIKLRLAFNFYKKDLDFIN